LTRSLTFIALSSASSGDIPDASSRLYNPIRQCPYGRVRIPSSKIQRLLSYGFNPILFTLSRYIWWS